MDRSRFKDASVLLTVLRGCRNHHRTFSKKVFHLHWSFSSLIAGCLLLWEHPKSSLGNWNHRRERTRRRKEEDSVCYSKLSTVLLADWILVSGQKLHWSIPWIKKQRKIMVLFFKFIFVPFDKWFSFDKCLNTHERGCKWIILDDTRSLEDVSKSRPCACRYARDLITRLSEHR